MNIEDIEKQKEAAWAAFRQHSLEAERQEAVADSYLTLFNKLEALLHKHEDATLRSADGPVNGAAVLTRNEEY